GYRNGYAAGHAEGLATGEAEVRRTIAQMRGILDGFTRPLARLEGEVAEALGDLAVRIAGTLLGTAYKADPTLLADLVREALDSVGSTSREIELRLHPDDLGALAPHLAGLSGVRLTADTALGRGELRLHSERVRGDGTLAARLSQARPAPPALGLAREGVLRRAVGLTLEASGCSAPLGSHMRVETAGGRWIDAEVVGFSGERTFLMPTDDIAGLLPNARVISSRKRGEVAVGDGLLGRVIDSDGLPLDGRGPIRPERWVGLGGESINPLMREPISQSLDVGVRAINALLPIGRGQRIGLFAGSGV